MSSAKTVEFIPQPPTKLFGKEGERDLYLWYITEDESLRLNKLFHRNFQETGMGGTLVVGLPSPCPGCGKYHEFIDWAWTAIMRSVHSSDFIFNALMKSRQGVETQHDVYCSECGMLTIKRVKDASEGNAPDIYQAQQFHLPKYQPTLPSQRLSADPKPPMPVVTWGRWWLDNSGKCLVKKYGDQVPKVST
ncbi:unnamed protein product [Rhizoctonia solani]|uniref:Uncharacterized protein n=1 Tax=Rhizoctonia solani TaxID=456999 RepID=A0A8H3DYZ1_9AGAM|nr:unnamed protein product [Rhizoctonia solani]